jgi:DNA-binding NarL/FixJ family response regulator
MAKGKTIRVQIADDHDVVVQGVTSILEAESDIEVVGPAITSGDDLMEKIREVKPDVLLLDVKMPNFDMLTALDRLTGLAPRLRTIVVTAQQDPQLVKAAAEKGAAGYILKEEALSSLLPLAIRGVIKGGLWFSPRSTQHLMRGGSDETDLSEYQRDVLRLMVLGKTPHEIAKSLQRSVGAIYSAQSQIREKLGVETNEQAIVAVIRDRIVPLSSD